MKDIILKDNEWVQLKSISEPKKGVNGYVYSHEKRCNGKIVSILPYRITKDNGIEFLLRKELTPCWSMDEKIVSSITGGCDEVEPKEDAVRELFEEAGYEIDKKDLIDLGTCFGAKSSDTVYYLYSINLTDVEKTGDASGDGSQGEKDAICFWSKDINNAKDPLVYVSFTKLHLSIDI